MQSRIVRGCRQTAPYSPAPDSDHVLWTRKRLNHRTCRKPRHRLSATSTSSRKANSAKLADLVPIQSRSQQANRHRSCSGKATLGKQCFHHFSEWRLINPRPSLAPRFRSQASVQPHATPPVSLRPANLLLNTAEWGREKQISSRGHTSPG